MVHQSCKPESSKVLIASTAIWSLQVLQKDMDKRRKERGSREQKYRDRNPEGAWGAAVDIWCSWCHMHLSRAETARRVLMSEWHSSCLCVFLQRSQRVMCSVLEQVQNTVKRICLTPKLLSRSLNHTVIKGLPCLQFFPKEDRPPSAWERSMFLVFLVLFKKKSLAPVGSLTGKGP